jgi:hypothetical protein
MKVSGELQSPAALPLMERAAGTHLIGGWMGPRVGLDAVSNIRITNPRRDSNTDRPARSQSLY